MHTALGEILDAARRPPGAQQRHLPEVYLCGQHARPWLRPGCGGIRVEPRLEGHRGHGQRQAADKAPRAGDDDRLCLQRFDQAGIVESVDLGIVRITDQVQRLDGRTLAVQIGEIGVCAATEQGRRLVVAQRLASERDQMCRRAPRLGIKDEPRVDRRRDLLQRGAQVG